MESKKSHLHFSKPAPAQSWFAVKHGKDEESSMVKSAFFVWHKIPIRDTSLESGVTPKDLETGRVVLHRLIWPVLVATDYKYHLRYVTDIK